MRKLISLVILLLLSNPLLSQTSNTNLTNCYSDSQVTEIFKGLKQNEYLKDRLVKAEITLDSADKLIGEQKYKIQLQEDLLRVREDLILGEINKCASEKQVLNAEIIGLNSTIALERIEHNRIEKKQYWKGLKTGGIVVGVLGIVTAVLISR